MRALASVLGKLLLLFVVLELADVPLICADERPSDETTQPVVRMVDGFDSVTLTSPAPKMDDGDPCFCPCHSSFRSASASRLPSTGTWVGLTGSPHARGIPGPPRALDHPPQNLL